MSPAPLPRVEAGDYVVIHDTGPCISIHLIGAATRLLRPMVNGRLNHHNQLHKHAGGYTLALFSRYCSRAAPAVVGYTFPADGGPPRIEVLQEAEPPESVLGFWGDRRGL